MTTQNKKKFFYGFLLSFVVCLLVFGGMLTTGNQALAQVTIDPDLGTTFGLGTADLYSTIIRVVQWALGFLALVAVIIIMYGGFIWMTARGNPDKVAKAKKILISAVIGLVIILTAWAIVTFVVKTIHEATNGSGAGCTIGNTEICRECVDNGSGVGVWVYHPEWDNCSISSEDFTMQSVETSHDGADPNQDVHRCSAIKPVFNHKIDDVTIQTAAGNGTLQIIDSSSAAVAGSWTTLKKSSTFKHPTLFDAFETYELQMPKTVADTAGLSLDNCTVEPLGSCQDMGTYYAWQFTTNNTLDAVSPYITSSYPIYDNTDPSYPDRNVSRAPIFRVVFNESIDDTTIIDTDGTPIDGNFVLEQLDENGVPVATYNSDQLQVSQTTNGFEVKIEDPFLNPLESFTWYRITVANIEDLCANPMDSPTVWEFETNDTMPGVKTWYPRGSNECPDAYIGIVFNTSMYYQQVSFGVADGQSISIGPLEANIAGPPYQITDGNGNMLRVVDPNIGNPSDGFKHFELRPASGLPANSNFNVTVTTDMVKDIDGNLLDQSWSFQTTTPETCVCSPTITSINPNQGLNGECLTIRGVCFKGTTEHEANPSLEFEFGGANTPATVEGVDPAGRWLTTTLPNAYANGNRPEAVVSIDYVEDEYDPVPPSNPFEFFVNGDGLATGPCLYTVSPGEGYPNITEVSLKGIRFDETSATREVHFNLATDKLGLLVPNSWSDTQARAVTPIAGAGDYGENQVWIENDAGTSNSMPYVIKPIPPDVPIVLDYEPTCGTACINAAIHGVISKNVAASISTATVGLYSCSDPSCIFSSLNPIALNNVTAVYNGGTDQTEFQLQLAAPGVLDVNTDYRVVLSDGITSDIGVALGNLNFDLDNNGTRDSYSWTFKTRDDPTLCTIETVEMKPASTTKLINTAISYTAYAKGIPDTCSPSGQTLDPSGFSWTWGINDPIGRVPAVASINSNTLNNASIQTAIRTDADPVFVETTADDGSGNTASGAGELHIIDCETDQHCRDNCPGSSSVCDPVNKRCTPAITSLNPNQGPKDTTVTVNGCYFGSSQGDGTVQFGGEDAYFPCGNASWSNDQIIVQNPSTAASGTILPVDVRTDSNIGGLWNEAADQGLFTMTDLCNGVPVPVNGMPGICPPLVPASGEEGDLIHFDGYNLYGNYPNAFAQFSDGIGGYINATAGNGAADGSFYENAPVPDNAQTGPARVAIRVGAGPNDYCPSNSVNFGISCNVDSDCSTNCCKSKICKPAGECSSGGPGDLCLLPTNAPFCQNGPAGTASGDLYRCIDPVGHLDPEPPASAAYPPDAVDDCRFCCDANPPMSSGNLTCVPDKVPCDSASGDRGLYCGCTSDADCGALGCGFDDPDRCCYPRPVVDSTLPDSADDIYCTNGSIQYFFETFGLRMKRDSMNSSSILVTDGGGNTINGTISTNSAGFVFTPSTLLTPGSQITIQVTTDVKNQYGVAMAAADTKTWDVNANATICEIDDINFIVQKFGSAPYSPPDTFSCAFDNCSDDMDNVTAGNQHDIMAVAVDKNNNPVSATYTWAETDTEDVMSIDETATGINNVITANSNAGHGFVNVEASAQFFSDIEDGRARVNVTLCENPWPNPFAPTNDQYPFEDSQAYQKPDTIDGPPSQFIANYSIWYCRDPGSLPLSKPSDEVVVRENDAYDPADDKDELVKEYFILRDGSSDGIGIRVMENEQRRSPTEWYRNQFGPSAPSPQELTVDGYSAIRAGRTVYVSVLNLDDTTSTLTPYIYLISYNEGASEETITIYNRLLKNWQFNVNMSETDKAHLQRDMQRLGDLDEIYQLLLTYKGINTTFPMLAAGTYISGMSVSTWLSWQETLGGQLIPLAFAPQHETLVQALRSLFAQEAKAAGSLPVDPLNNLYLCPLAYRQELNSEVALGNDVDPAGISYDAAGNVYVVSYETNNNKKLWKCNSNVNSCSEEHAFADQANSYPSDVTVDKKTGDILVAIAGWVGQGGRVERFDADDLSAPKQTYDIDNANGISTDSEGNMYITRINWDNGVYKYDADGNLLAEDNIAGNCADGDPCPWGIELDEKGNVYVSDRNEGKVKMYDNDLTGVQKEYFLGIAAVGLDVEGDSIFTTGHFSDYIFELDKDLTTLKNAITSPAIDNPYGISAFNGGFYFANYTNHSVHKYVYDEDSANTCWNEVAHSYYCPAGSHIYQYAVGPSGEVANLYANMEYDGPGSAGLLNNYAGDPCTDVGYCEDPNCTTAASCSAECGSVWHQNSFCSCFNHEFNATGTPNDHEGPHINYVDALIENTTNVVSGSREMTVDVSDGGSGVNRVEYYINGIRRFTDDDGTTGGWSWTFNSNDYADGDYTFMVRAYDNVSNRTSVSYNIQVNNSAGPDNTAPFVIINTPQAGDELKGQVTITAQASDNQIVSALEISVVGTTVINTCGTSSCTLDWNTAELSAGSPVYPNGQYTIKATATDPSLNTNTVEINVTVANIDYNNPVVAINAPTSLEVISGQYQVQMTATDDQAVDKVSIYINDIYKGDAVNSAGSTWTWDWNTLQYANNLYLLRAIAYDVQQNFSSASIGAQIDNAANDDVAPTAAFVRPPTPDYGSSVYNMVTMQVDATDNVGVAEVRFYQDYVWRSTDTVGGDGWNWVFDAERISAGWHTFQAVAYDAAGNESDSLEVRWNVRGGGGPICGDEIISSFIGEECDLTQFPSDVEDCSDLGPPNYPTYPNYYCGDIGCIAPNEADECTFDVSACIEGSCGDNTLQAACGEQCDGSPQTQCTTTNACYRAICSGCLCDEDLTNCDVSPSCQKEGAVPASIYCNSCDHCHDSVQNCGETGVDVGGGCAAQCVNGDQRCDGGRTQYCLNGAWQNNTYQRYGCTNTWDGICNRAGVGGGSCYTGATCRVVPAGGGLNNAFCEASGALTCNAACQSDWSDLYTDCCACGNGNIDSGEDCDPGPPENLDGQTCSSLGAGSGTLACNADCTWNLDGCTTSCTDNDGNCPAGCTICNDNDCPASTCSNGCCSGTSCVSQSDSQCGINGAVCQDCQASGELCNTATGQCVSCQDGDGLCPGTCTLCNDNDCPANKCSGCCSGTSCVAQSDTQCGVNSAACVDCTASGQVCDIGSGACVAQTCNSGNCANGCCEGTECRVYAQQSGTLCGTGGAACVSCNDSNVCTDDACSGSGVCTYTNNSAACTDHTSCTVNDQCTGGGCVGQPLVEGSLCTPPLGGLGPDDGICSGPALNYCYLRYHTIELKWSTAFNIGDYDLDLILYRFNSMGNVIGIYNSTTVGINDQVYHWGDQNVVGSNYVERIDIVGPPVPDATEDFRFFVVNSSGGEVPHEATVTIESKVMDTLYDTYNASSICELSNYSTWEVFQMDYTNVPDPSAIESGHMLPDGTGMPPGTFPYLLAAGQCCGEDSWCANNTCNNNMCSLCVPGNGTCEAHYTPTGVPICDEVTEYDPDDPGSNQDCANEVNNCTTNCETEWCGSLVNPPTSCTGMMVPDFYISRPACYNFSGALQKCFSGGACGLSPSPENRACCDPTKGGYTPSVVGTTYYCFCGIYRITSPASTCDQSWLGAPIP